MTNPTVSQSHSSLFGSFLIGTPNLQTHILRQSPLHWSHFCWPSIIGITPHPSLAPVADQVPRSPFGNDLERAFGQFASLNHNSSHLFRFPTSLRAAGSSQTDASFQALSAVSSFQRTLLPTAQPNLPTFSSAFSSILRPTTSQSGTRSPIPTRNSPTDDQGAMGRPRIGSSSPSANSGSENGSKAARRSGRLLKKEYRCKICGHRFTQPRGLANHDLIHRDSRPHVCQYPGCGKAFRQSGHLATHKMIHTGEKPFRCPVPGCPSKPFRHANRKCPVHPHARLEKTGQLPLNLSVQRPREEEPMEIPRSDSTSTSSSNLSKEEVDGVMALLQLAGSGKHGNH